MGIKENRINKLIELFKKNEVISTEEIKIKLSINERSVKSYIGYLRELGAEIVSENKKYKITKRQKLNGNLISKQDFRKMLVVIEVANENGKYNRKLLIKEILKKLCDENSVSEKTIKRDIINCEERGDIYKDEDDKYRISVDVETLEITTEEEVFDFIELCNIYKENAPFYKDIKKLKNKIIKSTGFEEFDYNICCIGRKYCDEVISKEYVKVLERFNYRKNAIKIKYNSKIGVLVEGMQVVTILYSMEKDKAYLIGIVNKKMYFINIDTIISIESTYIKNDFYGNKKIIDKLDLMFSASLDGPYEVKVEFENIFNIKEKIIRLHNNRAKSTIEENNGKIIYCDTIYGIYDFAKYLRRFGSSCRVLEPFKLIEIMKNTYKKILLNYRGEA